MVDLGVPGGEEQPNVAVGGPAHQERWAAVLAVNLQDLRVPRRLPDMPRVHNQTVAGRSTHNSISPSRVSRRCCQRRPDIPSPVEAKDLPAPIHRRPTLPSFVGSPTRPRAMGWLRGRDRRGGSRRGALVQAAHRRGDLGCPWTFQRCRRIRAWATYLTRRVHRRCCATELVGFTVDWRANEGPSSPCLLTVSGPGTTRSRNGGGPDPASAESGPPEPPTGQLSGWSARRGQLSRTEPPWSASRTGRRR